MKTPFDLDKIYNKLPKEKTELSVKKVELAIMKDLQKATNKYIKEKKSFDNITDAWYTDLFKIRDKFSF